MGKKYYVSREESWQKEVTRGQEVDQGIGVLLNIDLYLASAFDILEHDKYGEMQTYNYSSVKKEIEKCRDKNDDIVNYARTIHGTLKDKENDFHKQFSKALEELSKLNINDYQVENTLGITEFKEVMATRDSDPITIEQKKSKITYADIMGKTDMMGLSKQFEEYVNTQRPNQKLSEAEISRLKEEFYDGVLTTSFEHKVYNDGWLNGASELLDFIPVVSGVKSTLEGIVGYTLTGEKLSDSERAQYIALGLVSGAVDVLTLGSGAVLTQGVKVAAKSLATSFVKTAAIDIGVGYGTKLVTTGLMNLGLPPEMVMGIHILTNLAYMGYNMSKASKVDDSFKNLNTKVDDVKLPDGTWANGATTRGKIIDDCIGNNVGKNYPTIDMIDDNGIVTSVKSRDLDCISYQNGNTLENTIKNDINKLDDFNGATWGGTTIKPNEINGKQLQMVVPNTTLNQGQITAINNAIGYGKQSGINIIVTVGR